MKGVAGDETPIEQGYYKTRFFSTRPAVVARRCAVAIICVLVAFGIRYWLTPVLGEELPFMLFVAAALIAAWYGGAVTGILALLLGLLLGDYFFVREKGPTRLPYSVETLQFIRYFFTASLGIILIEVLHRDRRRTQAAAQELRRQIASRERTELALREAQAQLRRYADGLEKRVEERTSRLTATVNSLRDLLYHIAHNLRAPLRAMEGYSTLLIAERDISLKPACRDHLHHISEAATRMDELIQALLEYGRLGQMELVLGKVSLDRAVERVLSQLTYEIQTRHAKICVAGPLPEVNAADQVLQQILTNLIENALKFVPPGVAPQVRLWAEVRGNKVRLFIEDNGIGIDPRYHERIFGVFESLYPNGSNRGTGIGLAIVKQGVQRLGGQVGVESEPGVGSRFWIELQAADEVALTA